MHALVLLWLLGLTACTASLTASSPGTISAAVSIAMSDLRERCIRWEARIQTLQDRLVVLRTLEMDEEARQSLIVHTTTILTNTQASFNMNQCEEILVR